MPRRSARVQKKALENPPPTLDQSVGCDPPAGPSESDASRPPLNAETSEVAKEEMPPTQSAKITETSSEEVSEEVSRDNSQKTPLSTAEAAEAARARIAPKFSVLQSQKELSLALKSLQEGMDDSLSSSNYTLYVSPAGAHSDSYANNEESDDAPPNCANQLLDILKAHNNKEDPIDLRELLELMSTVDVQEIWFVAWKIVDKIASEKSYLVDEVEPVDEESLNLSVAESLIAEANLDRERKHAVRRAQVAHDILFSVASLALIAVQPRNREEQEAASSRPPCEALFQTVKTLHGLLFELALCNCEAIALIVARCCERWWVAEWTNREDLVTQLLPYLLATAMSNNAKHADVKRLYGVRHALELLDFDDASAETIRGLLLRGMSSEIFLKKKPKRKSRAKPKTKKKGKKRGGKAKGKGNSSHANDGKKGAVNNEHPDHDSAEEEEDEFSDHELALRNDESEKEDEDATLGEYDFPDILNRGADDYSAALSEGQRVLAFSFGLNATLASDMYSSMKAHLPHSTSAQQLSHGVILFRAWKSSLVAEASETRTVIEEQCIQDLMATSIKVESTFLFNACRRVLQAFTSQKRRDGVDEMLLRLYNPIIWRGLSAANPTVRKQAGVLFIDAFPLQDPGAPNVETDALLLKQFSELQRLLEDEIPDVRTIAVEGSARILAEYWNLVPVRFAKKMLTTMVDRLARDASSTAVRAAVVEGLDHLINNCSESHAAMKVVLPRLQMLLHDKSAKVRKAFVRLLVGIRDVNTIAVADVVPVSHLHARLVADADIDNISSLLVRLLLPTYYPQSTRSAVQLERASTLLLSSPTSALVFFRRLHTVLSVQKVCKLVLLFRRLVNSLVIRLVDDAGEEDAGASLAESNAENNTDGVVRGKRSRETNGRLRQSLGADMSSNNSSTSNAQHSLPEEHCITDTQQQLVSDIRLILVGMRILWASVHSELQRPHFGPALELMQDEFTSEADYGTVDPDDLSSCTFFHMLLRIPLLNSDSACRAEIFALCGMLPHETVGELKERLLPRILNLNSNLETECHELECLVQTLCRWGVGPQLVALATQSMQHALMRFRDEVEDLNDPDNSSLNAKRKRHSESQNGGEADVATCDEGDVTSPKHDQDLLHMPFSTSIRVLQLCVAGNIGGIRDQILSNAQWSKRLIEAAYLSRPVLEKRLLELTTDSDSYTQSIDHFGNKIDDDSLVGSFELFCKLLVHGAAADEERARTVYATSLANAAQAARRKKGRKSEADKEAIKKFEIAKLNGDILGHSSPQFPRELLRTIQWTTRLVFGQSARHTEEDNDSSDDEYAFAGRSAGKGGLMDLISSPAPVAPSKHRRKAMSELNNSSFMDSPGSIRSGRDSISRFSKLACKVAVLVSGLIADCAAMGYRDCTASRTFVRRNVAQWEEAAVDICMSINCWRDSESGAYMEKALSRNMKRLSKWRKRIMNRSSTETKEESVTSSHVERSKEALDKENAAASPSSERVKIGEKNRYRKDGSAFLARMLIKKKRPNTPIGRAPLSVSSQNGESSPAAEAGLRSSSREKIESDLSKMLDDSVVSNPRTPARTEAAHNPESSGYDYHSAHKAAYEKLMQLVDSGDEGQSP